MTSTTHHTQPKAVLSWLRPLGRLLVPLTVLAAGLAATSAPADASGAAVVIDAFGNPSVAAGPFTRSVTELPPANSSTTPPGTFSTTIGLATMTSTGAGNGVGGTTLSYTPTGGGSVDLTSGGNNNQILVDFSEIDWTDWQPGDDAVIVYADAVDSGGCHSVLGSDGVANYFAFNAAFPFSDFTADNCTFDWSNVTSLAISFTFSGNYLPGTLTVGVNRIWATPETANPPSNPGAAVTAPATAAGIDTTPLDFAVAFTSNQGAAPVTYHPPSDTGLRAQDLDVSGTAFGSATPVLSITGGPSTYTAAVSGMTEDGTVTLHVPASIVEDAFLQYNTASSSDPVVQWTKAVPPEFVSPDHTTFTAGTAGDFTVDAMGGSPTPVPYPAMTVKSGTLPEGLTLTDNGDGTATIAGTPAAGTGGTYVLTLAATNAASSVTQSFTLTVDAASLITSAGTATFTAGAQGTFTVTTGGYPNAAISETGALPSGVTFTDNGSGTATIAGSPAAEAGGAYDIVITAGNGVGSSATQDFTLDVDQGPAISSGASTTFTVGTDGAFTIGTSGYPAATVSTTSALPSGLTLTSNGDGTATLSGTPAAGTGAVYDLTIDASNGVAPEATQSFTLTVDEASSFTSAGTANFTVGASGSFIVTTGTEYPTPPSMSLIGGQLPTGVTFTDNGNGTATISGPPAASTGGAYELTLGATNGVGTAATQDFDLVVDQAPAITSAASDTATVGTSGSFTITTTGYPVATLSSPSVIPVGLTLTPNGNGSVTVSGAPGAGTGGTYNIVIDASNGVGPDATQNFTLTVGDPASVTSAGTATFSEGANGTFTVQTAGYPVAAVTETGALPSGVTFTDNGDGTATIAGTPAAGTGGTYPVTIGADNNVGLPGAQDFTLLVDEAPAITSAAGATFSIGGPNSFSITTTGYPDATLSEAGAMPSGLTFTDNGDGTATLAGTPAGGTSGSYPVTITADNNVGAAATEPFTISVVQPAPAAAHLLAPTITSKPSTTFTVGIAGSYSVTTGGDPSPSVTEVGALPAGVTFTDNGNGTATIVGTPGAGTAGTYLISVTASDGLLPAATQAFMLDVVTPGGTSAPGTPETKGGHSPTAAQGLLLAGADGGVFAFGGDKEIGSLANKHLAKPVVGIAATPGAKGYWLVTANGAVYGFGNAKVFGSLTGTVLAKPVVSIAASADGKGYWLVTSNGAVYGYGDAKVVGSLIGKTLAKPVVGIAASADGKGYWLVTANGVVYGIGDARVLPSVTTARLTAPVVGIAASAHGNGYWLATAEGAVYGFGAADVFGSLTGTALAKPVVGIAGTPDALGYWLVTANGVVHGFGDALLAPSLAGTRLAKPVVGLI